jgi:hypothetical protein
MTPDMYVAIKDAIPHLIEYTVLAYMLIIKLMRHYNHTLYKFNYIIIKFITLLSNFIIKIGKSKNSLTGGFEPPTFRLTAERSTD